MALEEEWWAHDDHERMIAVVRELGSDWKNRLLACACCYRVYKAQNELELSCVAVAERYADGLASALELSQAAQSLIHDNYRYSPAECAASEDSDWVLGVADAVIWALDYEASPDVDVEALEREFQVALLRDIFDNPFRPVALNPLWLTSDVLALARGIYHERAFDRMPILADALQDAGCANENVLTHCREPGVHVRGCWVVDLLLGKS